MSGPPPSKPPRRGRLSPTGRAAEEADPVPVSEALAVVGGDLGLGDPSTLAVIAEHWTSIVGDAVAGHARLRTLRAGVLTIAVDAPPWATELRYLAGEVGSRISALVASDAVQEVRIVVEPPA
jgi:hypothetical protein